MSHFFTLLCKLIVTNISGKNLFHVKRQTAETVSADVVNCKGCTAFPQGCENEGPCKPTTATQPERPSWSWFNIFSFLQINLAPVAVERPVFAYTNHTCTTTQTNRMKQILRAAKGSALCFFILLMGVLAGQKSSAQTTYTWNTGSGTWGTSTSWSPTRTTPAANDILIKNATGQA